MRANKGLQKCTDSLKLQKGCFENTFKQVP